MPKTHRTPTPALSASVPSEGSATGIVPEDNPSAEALIRQAIEEIRNHTFDSAHDALNEAKRLNPKQRGLWSTYAALYDTTDDVDMAIESLKTEIGHLSKAAGVGIANSPGCSPQIRGADDAAFATLRDLLKVAPSDPTGVHDLSRLLMNARRFDEAVELTGEAVAASPANVEFEALSDGGFATVRA